MDKIAEIKESLKVCGNEVGEKWLHAMKTVEANAPEWLDFLLSELEKETAAKVKLREERDSWERVARLVEEEKQSAQKEIDRLKKQDADVIINYALERQKLIEGLRIIIKTSECPATVQRAYLILGEIGVTE